MVREFPVMGFGKCHLGFEVACIDETALKFV